MVVIVGPNTIHTDSAQPIRNRPVTLCVREMGIHLLATIESMILSYSEYQ